MTLTVASATARLSRQVPQTEQNIDQAIMSLSNLMASMVAARHVEGVLPGTGETAIQHVGKAIEGLMVASGEVAKAHARLRKIYEETGAGDFSDCNSASLTGLSAMHSKHA